MREPIDRDARAAAPPPSLVSVLRRRADEQPERVGYTVVDGSAQRDVTYGELDRLARAVAAQLRRRCRPGDRVLLLTPPGIDYVASFFGCLYAGVVAVPGYPPQPHRLQRSLPRLSAVAADCDPRLALSTAAICEHVRSAYADHPDLARLEWLAVDAIPSVDADPWRPDLPSPEAPAMLQYTSGSTATPKGVVLRHDNLVHSGQHIERLFSLTPEDRAVIWLPPYHDMGLIGGILQALHTGYPVVLLDPMTFVQRPMTWLRAISEHRATVSGGPNFAYDLCVTSARPQDIAELDLSGWRIAFNGAELVREQTLTRFAATFGPAGFRQSAFRPCYGLAEATLMVTVGREPAPRVVRSGPSAGSDRSLVSCGVPDPDQQVLVVDPETCVPCADGVEGEIWVAGPGVAQGYWQRDTESTATFRARPVHPGGDVDVSRGAEFLRTGDLGLIEGGELYVTGRLKDLMILRGVNHAPEDIEETVRGADPALAEHGGVAFTVDVDGAEALVVAHEVAPTRVPDHDAVAAAVRRAVGDQHDLAVHAVVLVRRGRLPRTTSGKLQRRAARAAYLDGSLPVLHRRQFAQRAGEDLAKAGTIADAPAPARAGLIEQLLRGELANRSGVAAHDVDLNLTGPQHGLDSLALVEVQHRLELAVGAPLPFAAMPRDVSVADIIRHIAEGLDTPRPAAGAAAPEQAVPSLSHGQRAMWFLQRLMPDSTAYNLAAAVRLGAGVDAAVAQRAVRGLVRRHPQLRAGFPQHDGEPVLRDGRAEPDFRHETLDAAAAARLPDLLAEAANQPFDLEDGPLLRVRMWTAAGQDPVLLFVVHHVVCDFWSLALLLRRFAEDCAAAAAETPDPDGDVTADSDYAAYVRWQADYLGSDEGRAAAEYWDRRLAGELPALNLPTDRPRPPVQSMQGGEVAFAVPASVARRLRELATATRTTAYTVLLSAFHVLLHRYTGQTDILVGSPAAGRRHARFASTVGYFVNPVVLRGDLRGNPSFRSLVAATARSVDAAMAHQDYPFPLLAERLQPVRDTSRTPVFQTMFLYQQPPQWAPEALGLLAIGRDDEPCDLGGLPLRSVAFPKGTAQFDLTLAVAPDGDGLAGVLGFSTALFDAATIERMAGHFVTLLGGIAAEPDLRIEHLPLLAGPERDELLRGRNATVTPYPVNTSVDRVIEQRVSQQPDAVAVVWRGRSMTYRELDERAERLARTLVRSGAGPESRVGLFVERSLDTVVGLLGVLKSGAAYIPLDPGHPDTRIGHVLDDAEVELVVTQRGLQGRLPADLRVVAIDEPSSDGAAAAPAGGRPVAGDGTHAAYVLYTSGSTGTPKGVVVTHRNVLNFFAGMDARVGCDADDTLLAVTSISFDISVLELLWTLARGARVVIVDDRALGRAPSAVDQSRLDFSLFYFASAPAAAVADRYRLVTEGARFADRHGFAAVWTPERHFHEFGGLYPNPSVLSAALATITERVALRAGSVVLPLHSPLRVAEEWAVVDNLSGGRAGIAFASGWHSDDFAFFPERYADRKRHMFEAIETVRGLWRGGSATVRGGAGNDIDVRVHPTPLQPELPVWITAAGSPETFVKAGEIGANVLTHLLGQQWSEVGQNIRAYRQARLRAGHDPAAGVVTMMLHTFIGDDQSSVRETVRGPFREYLRSSVGLIANLVRSLQLPLDLDALDPADMDALLDFAFDRYYDTSALFGTVETVQGTIEQCRTHGVDEIACLLDFGLPDEQVLAHLPNLAALRQRYAGSGERGQDAGPGLADQLAMYQPTLLQATPSMMRILAEDGAVLHGLRSLRALLLGGEPLTPALAALVRDNLPARLVNMYGPTETTVWSTTHEVEDDAEPVPIGRPIANTTTYIVSAHLEPVPAGVVGELVIGGDGVSRGYWGRPEVTAERFVPDPFGSTPGGRLYRTGDLARHRRDGTIEFVGRADHQVKVRGFRIELAEVERCLARHPAVEEVVVVAGPDGSGDVRLTAYLVCAQNPAPDPAQLRRWMRAEVPEPMVPARFVAVPSLPLTANGKIDRGALPAIGAAGGVSAPPATDLQRHIAGVWRELLQVGEVGIYDNFFDIGGHSLLMAQVHARLRPVIGGEVPLIKLFEHPTVGSLASFLSAQGAAEPTFEVTQERARRQATHRRTYSAPSAGAGRE